MKLITFGDVNLNYYFKNDIAKYVMPSGIGLDVLIRLNKEYLCSYMGNISKNSINMLSKTNIDFSNAYILDKDNKMFFYNNQISNVCPYCNRISLNNYNVNNNIINNIKEDDVIIYDNLRNIEIINKMNNTSILLLNNYNDIENYSLDELVNLMSNKFKLIILSLNVYHYIKDKFNIDSIDFYDLLHVDVLIIFRNKNGCDIIVDDFIYEKEIEMPVNIIEKSGGFSSFSSSFVDMILKENIINEKVVSKYFMLASNNYLKCVLSIGSTSNFIPLNNIKNYHQCICNEIEI